jgi:hypothetical protein
MDRLLSEQEMRTIGLCVISQSRDGYVTGEGVTQMQIDTAAAQLAKTDKEWVEWVVTNAEVEGEDIILPGKLWRERRKEIGI